MERTYDPARRVVKGMSAYLLRMRRHAARRFRALPLLLVLAVPCSGQAQGLPEFGPLNPVASSRSGLYFQPFREAEPGRWRPALALDYGSVIEYNRLDQADYVLDSEVLRLTFGASRDLGRRTFLALSVSLDGAYAGFLDGFLDWYHGKLGIRVSEREQRPQDRFLYSITLPDGRTVARSSGDLFLGDIRAGLGIRVNSQLQTVLSLTLPTSTGPEGYGRGVPSVAVLNTLRVPLTPRLVYEGSLGVGLPRRTVACRISRTRPCWRSAPACASASGGISRSSETCSITLRTTTTPRFPRSTGGSCRWISAGYCRPGVGETGG